MCASAHIRALLESDFFFSVIAGVLLLIRFSLQSLFAYALVYLIQLTFAISYIVVTELRMSNNECGRTWANAHLYTHTHTWRDDSILYNIAKQPYVKSSKPIHE